MSVVPIMSLVSSTQYLIEKSLNTDEGMSSCVKYLVEIRMYLSIQSPNLPLIWYIEKVKSVLNGHAQVL